MIGRASFLAVMVVFATSQSSPGYDLKPEIWKPLLSYRPPAPVQKKVKARGDGWEVHRIENGNSYLNLDYYSIRVTKMPAKGDKTLNAKDVFDAFKQHLVDPMRDSAKRVEFSKEPGAEDWQAPGSLVRLRFRPYTMASCQTLSYCGDIDWLKKSEVCKRLDDMISPLLGMGSFDDAYVVVGMSAPQELRVCTVQGGTPLAAPFTAKNTGRHPVAGNRAFGYSTSSGGMVIYTIGADRLNGLMPGIDDPAASFGYCSAEVFWREFLHEFSEWVRRNGGVAETGTSERKKLDWGTSQNLWAPDLKWID